MQQQLAAQAQLDACGPAGSRPSAGARRRGDDMMAQLTQLSQLRNARAS